MGKRYLIDTNILIEYSSNNLPNKAQKFVSEIIDEDFNISVINKIEILSHNSAGKQIEDFIDLSKIIPLTDNVINMTIELRKSNKSKLPDAVIAATAIVNDFILLTRNIKDFEKISELNVINPHNI
jgi:predicted nucleic acid-binding protein